MNEQKEITCLVIQLARLGDTIQSLMALRAVKQLYPSLKIEMVVRKNFSDAVRRVDWIDRVIELPTQELLEPILKSETSELQVLADLATWSGGLVRDRPWDFVVNWSFSPASSYLSALVPCHVRLGYSRKDDMEMTACDGWSQYFQAIVQGEVPQDIHLTDILTTQLLTALQIRAGDPAPVTNEAVTSRDFFKVTPLESDRWKKSGTASKWMALQLGASQENKSWTVERWTQFARYVLARHPDWNLVLLGGQSDRAKADLILDALGSLANDPGRVVSMVGRTGFDLWASIIGQVQWLVAPDTAAIHLASVLGTRVLNLSIAPARWNDTGPYGNGHYVVASRNGYGDQPLAEVAYGAWSYGSSEWFHKKQKTLSEHFSQLGWSKLLKTAAIFRSRVRQLNEGGGVAYEPQHPVPIDLSGWTSMVMGHVARALYCGWSPPVGQGIERERITPDLIRTLRNLDDSVTVLKKICDEAQFTSHALQKFTAGLKSDRVMNVENKTEVQRLGARLAELDRLMERVTESQPELKSFIQLNKVMMHNINGSSLADLARESATCYRILNDAVSLMKQWSAHSLGLGRPVAVPVDSAIDQTAKSQD